MRSVVRRAVGFVAETLALFAAVLFTIWAVRRLRNTAFINLMAPLALAGPGAYSACGRRRALP